MDNKSPLFSILIANYNNGQFLQLAIESALNQTYKNIEVIVIDDNSIDDSREVILKFCGDSRFKYILLEKNEGQGYVKSELIDKCKGDYFGYLDSDDVLDKYAVQEMIEKHIKNADVSLIYSQCYLCDAELNIIRIWERTTEIPKDSDYLHFGKYAIFQFVSFSKRHYNMTIGMCNTDLRAMDQDLFYKMEEKGKVLYNPIPLYYYRRHMNSLTSRDSQLKSLIWHLEYIKNACKRRGIENEYYDIAFNLIYQREKSQSRRKSYKTRLLKKLKLIYSKIVKY
jgi:glycosyltransferase involved in cell wall biosynthesis